MDQIMHLAKLLSEGHFQHRIKHDLEKLVHKYVEIPHVKLHSRFTVHNEGKPDCFVAFEVAPESNVFRQKLTILIKPDHSNHRILRTVVQEDSKVEMNSADDDHANWDDRKVFMEELHDLEKDIKDMLKDMMKKEHVGI